MKELLIYGAANPQIVKIVDAINEKENTWKTIGFLDDFKKNEAASYMGHPILGGEEMIQPYRDKGCYFINNVFSTTEKRRIVTQKLKRFQVNYATLVSPRVDMLYVHVGSDCLILDGVILGANVSIGSHVMIRANSSINHDTVIEENVFIGPGVTICGNVKVEEGAYIGAGAVIKDGLVIHYRSTVGMGAIVNEDVMEGDIVAVPPARSVKNLIPLK
jgi:sugar O-acyltransferase (sialic acid O-acetyltransferase NeuD family)